MHSAHLHLRKCQMNIFLRKEISPSVCVCRMGVCLTFTLYWCFSDAPLCDIVSVVQGHHLAYCGSLQNAGAGAEGTPPILYTVNHCWTPVQSLSKTLPQRTYANAHGRKTIPV